MPTMNLPTDRPFPGNARRRVASAGTSGDGEVAPAQGLASGVVRDLNRADGPGSGDTARRDDVVVLLLAEVKASARLWGWSRIVLGGRALRAVPGVRLVKALGSGHEGGFGLRPSASRQGLLVLFDREQQADDFIQRSPVVQQYRQCSNELIVAKLRATSSRGSWSGADMAVTAATPASGPVAALTRASIRPGRALSFWRHSPLSEQSLATAAGCRLAVGLGEAPVLRQATFSVWDSQASMDAYARGGAHRDAIQAALAGGWFSESMFVRFVPVLLQGCWRGQQHQLSAAGQP